MKTNCVQTFININGCSLYSLSNFILYDHHNCMLIASRKIVYKRKVVCYSPGLGCAGLIASDVVLALLVLNAVIEWRAASVLDL